MPEVERLSKQNRLLSVLLNVSNLSSQDAEPHLLAEAVLERLHGLLFCDASLCYTLEGNRLVYLARKGPLHDFVGKHVITHSQFPIGKKLLNSRQPFQVTDLWAEEPSTIRLREQLASFLDGPGSVSRCWMFLPMVLNGRTTGVLMVAHHQPDFFTKEDRVFGAAFAHQAAIEFENARLGRDARRRADEVRTMLEVQRAIARRVEPRAVLQLIADEASRLTAGDGALVFLQEKGHWQFSSVSGTAVRLSPMLSRGTSVPPLVEKALNGLAHTKRAYHLQPERPGYERHESLMKHYGLFNMLCVPIVAGEDPHVRRNGTLPDEHSNQVWGIIGVTDTADRSFRADDLRLLTLLASSAIIGMENARLYESERQLRAQEAERAASAERVRLARELHDAVTQTLFSASLTAEVLPRIWDRDPGQGKERLEEVRLLTRGALAEMRTLLLELRPKAMEDAPLEELLKQLVNATSGRLRIPITCTLEPCGELPFDIKLGMYRIAQEAMNNIVKHAEATCVAVSVSRRDLAVDHPFPSDSQGVPSDGLETSLCLDIRDDGAGFDPNNIPGGHLGIEIMRERAESFGAAFHVDSQPGKGTTIQTIIRLTRTNKNVGSGVV